LKWYLKAAEQNEYKETTIFIGLLFENGHGVPLDKYRALEWHCHSGYKANINRLKGEGYHRSATDKSKLNHIVDSLY
jgi:TPR repeat protein